MKTKIIFTTCPTQEEAQKIAANIVEERLAACIQIIPNMTSVYHWEGKIETSSELLLIIKSTEERLPALEKKVIELHSYDTPEFVSVDTEHVSEKYQNWLFNYLA